MPGVARVLGNQEKLQAAAWRGDGSHVSPIGAARAHAPVAVDGLLGRARAFMDVQQGCDHACTFCIIPQGRGLSRSVAPGAAVAQLRRLVEAGVQEVVLTGVDLASWSQNGLRLGDLVRTLLQAVPGLPRLRLGSLDPAALDESVLGGPGRRAQADAASPPVLAGRIGPGAEAYAAAARAGGGAGRDRAGPAAAARPRRGPRT